MSAELFTFPNLGYLIDDVPNDLLNKLNKIVREKNLEKHNMKLAGNIKKEFAIPKAIGFFENYILNLCKQYDHEFNYVQGIRVNKTSHPFFLESMWVNFQEKYEFNPVHIHSGIFSFVIWLEVPYTMEKEKEVSPGKESNFDRAGCFQFHFTDALGAIQKKTIYADKTYEGKICLFPALLNHSVNPFFSSNDYRISVSGNVLIDI